MASNEANFVSIKQLNNRYSQFSRSIMNLKLKLISRSKLQLFLFEGFYFKTFQRGGRKKTAEEKSKLYFPLAKHREFGYSKKVNKLVSFMMIYFLRWVRKEKKLLTKPVHGWSIII